MDALGKAVGRGMAYGESRTGEEIDLYTSPSVRPLLAARDVTKVPGPGAAFLPARW